MCKWCIDLFFWPSISFVLYADLCWMLTWSIFSHLWWLLICVCWLEITCLNYKLSTDMYLSKWCINLFVLMLILSVLCANNVLIYFFGGQFYLCCLLICVWMSIWSIFAYLWWLLIGVSWLANNLPKLQAICCSVSDS